MDNFGVWIKRQARDGSDPDLCELQKFATTNVSTWPFESDKLEDYIAAVWKTPDDKIKERTVTFLGRAHQRWILEKSVAVSQSWKQVFQNNFGTVLLTLFGVIVALMLAYGLYSTSFFISLAKPEQARGLITFLFAFSTIAIFILVAIATFFMSKDGLEQRFSNAKDLITIVIGVLGTILGFYFGSASTDNLIKGPNISNTTLSRELVQAGTSTEISAVVLGGVAPFDYDITFENVTGDKFAASAMNVKGSSSNGNIRQTINIPSDISSPAVARYTVTATDKAGAVAKSVGALFLMPASAKSPDSPNPAAPPKSEAPPKPPAPAKPGDSVAPSNSPKPEKPGN